MATVETPADAPARPGVTRRALDVIDDRLGLTDQPAIKQRQLRIHAGEGPLDAGRAGDPQRNTFGEN